MDRTATSEAIEAKGEPESASVIGSRFQTGAYTGILLFALVLGLFVAFSHISDPATSLTGDAVDYHRLALGLLKNGSYDSLTRAPGYPAIVALAYAVAGAQPSVLYFLQAVLFVITLILVHRIALYVTRDRITALITMALCAGWPPFYWHIHRLLGEVFAAFTTALMMWTLFRAIQKPGWLRSAAAGVTITIAALTKAVVLPFLFLAPLFMLSGNGTVKRRSALAAVMLVAGAAALMPWTIRNYRVTDGHIVPVSLLAGLNMWYGNSPESFQLPSQSAFMAKYGRVKMGVNAEAVELDRELMRRGLARIKEDPKRAIGLFVLKFTAFWMGGIGRDVRGIPNPVPHIGTFGIPKMSFVQIPLFIGAVAGWFLIPVSSRRRAYPALLLMVICTGAYVLLYSEGRYALQIYAFKLLLVSVTIVYVLGKLKLIRPSVSEDEA